MRWPGASPLLVVRDLGPGFDPRRIDAAAAAPVAPVDSGIEDLVDDPAELRAPGAQTAEGGGRLDGPDLDDLHLDDLHLDDPDLGLGPESGFTFAENGRGLFLVSHLAPALQAALRVGGGAEVSAELPVRRTPMRSHDPPRQTANALPTLAEARPEGGFGRESFLRALVVQLARAIEFQHGPDAADAAVAQVGIDVGGQMEEEFRQARGLVGRLGPEQLAECYVRLKHAIDGGFVVLEASEERVVLGNQRCPFGDVVRYAPSLCRMTSAVFGGIAARNAVQGADVILEERIAVGDPGCRVVVDLRPPAQSSRRSGHHYSTPEGAHQAR